MTSNQISSFISAVTDAGLNDYYFVTDMSTCLYNNSESSIIKINGDNVFCFRKALYANYRTNNGIELIAADAADIHEARTMGTAEQMKEIAQALGATLTDDEYNFLLGIDKAGVDLIPATGDYIEFVFLPEAEYEKLSDKEKAAYDEAKKFEGRPHGFRYLSKIEESFLNETDLATYNELKTLYETNKAKYISPGQAASISFK